MYTEASYAQRRWRVRAPQPGHNRQNRVGGSRRGRVDGRGGPVGVCGWGVMPLAACRVCTVCCARSSLLLAPATARCSSRSRSGVEIRVWGYGGLDRGRVSNVSCVRCEYTISIYDITLSRLSHSPLRARDTGLSRGDDTRASCDNHQPRLWSISCARGAPRTILAARSVEYPMHTTTINDYRKIDKIVCLAPVHTATTNVERP